MIIWWLLFPLYHLWSDTEIIKLNLDAWREKNTHVEFMQMYANHTQMSWLY